MDKIEVVASDSTGSKACPLACTREEILKRFQHQTHKGLVVVWFERTAVPWFSPSATPELADFKSFLCELGYKRSLILSGHTHSASVVWVVFDSADSSECMTKENSAHAAAAPIDSTAVAPPHENKDVAEGQNYEGAFAASEWIAECDYLGDQKKLNISYDNPPIAEYHWLRLFKGPPLGRDPSVIYEFRQGPQDKMPKDWKFGEDKMPERHTHWIIFVPNCVAEPGGGFRTYKGSHGRQEATERNLGDLKAVIEKHGGKP